MSNSVESTKKKICVFGSSSPRTREIFLEQAFQLGKRIAELGHICINGAGLHGCMGAVNQGCFSADGEVIGIMSLN
jgi:hypothetical protein